ncbi:MAG TPA: branched-chain amino acid ABC transporter ATP-binding protein/permease [Sporichthyaceae bacterium]|nr:branched-chain amino acid ABC transporter ATP-binding protein/permease [Sporichthyaceae bacterium]
MPVSQRTRPIRSAMTAGPTLCWIIAVVWVFDFADYQIFTVSAAIPLAIASLGLLVLQGWAREISLASAGLWGASLYWFGYLERPDNLGKGIPWVFAAIIAIGAVALLMMGIAAASVRLPGIYLVVITLGVQITLEKAVFTNGNLSGGISGGTELQKPITNPRPYFLGLPLQTDRAFYWFLLGWLVVVVLLLVRLRHSPAGRAFLLAGADRQAAAACGIAPLRYRLAAFATSGILAGLGGVLACWLYISAPIFLDYMAPTSLLLLSIPVLAGRDAIGWVLAIAVANQILPVALEQYHINTFLLAGVGLIGGALVGPRGMGGWFSDLRRRYIGHSDRAHLHRITGHELAPANTAPAIVADWLNHQPSPEAAALQVSNVGVRIDGLSILDGVSLDVPAGAFAGLIGPNGAGKSTLLDVISGFRPPDTGTVRLFGQDVTHSPAWRRPQAGMSRVFQSTRIIEDLTVADNLLLGAHHQLGSPTLAYLAGMRQAWDASAVAERAAQAIATMLAIDDRWDDRAGTLSFSGRRRIEIGRALLASPQILLLDEPAAGLDPNSSGAMFDLLRRLHSELGMTVLLVEHNVTAVLSVCELVHVLAAGKVLAGGTPAEIAANETVRANYLGNRLRFTAA